MNNRNFRYERKFKVEGLTKSGFEAMLKTLPQHFSEIYYERFVNNIYLDTPSFKNYRENVDGDRFRKKIRIRWYGDLHGEAEDPILEFKEKNGLLGTKRSYKLKNFRLGIRALNTNLEDLFMKSNLPESVLEELKGYSSALINRYKRKYFQSQFDEYRITLDSNLSYFRVSNISNNLYAKKDTIELIVELKYDREHDSGAAKIANLFPFRLTKMSKYVRGIDTITI